ncbi:hypothetical protein O9G_006301 [Rozella allomycis CSF55]|uniref:Uncharacterized protein n=1 Tax=Rozella allomycis (strain CSF55) TaxID=988480 RepID=A0A075AMX4_ROZAC|nr:hypothetical protein O9G_006301 [Rozella allomycis CSF55]|eukprot:EPZ31053.1 hypothetical protein O9G_006301 [Rozella allomycis CSF55]
MFYVLAHRRKRVVRICNNEWMYYDGSNVMMRKTDVWKEEDVYLLIDGKAGEEFLGKDKRAVLFASSSIENYWQFIKNTEGCIVYMKSWDYSELETFVGQMSEDERVKIGMPGKFEECRDMLTRRYDIVGGRIRLILMTHMDVKLLKIEIARSLASVSVEVLEDLDMINVREWVPNLSFLLLLLVTLHFKL